MEVTLKLMLHTNQRRSRPGFSLVEILIVIAILGILASLVTVGMIGHQKKARDAQRKSDLQTVKKALEAAKADCKSSAYYPALSIFGFSPTQEHNAYSSLTTILTNPNLKYLQSAPNDPKFVSSAVTTGYAYMFTTETVNVCLSVVDLTLARKGAEQFVLRAKLEISNDPDAKNSYTKCQSIANSTSLVSPLDPTPITGDGYFYECSN